MSSLPKSTARLKLGDYCAVKRADGAFVPLVFLSSMKKRRSSFYGALLLFVSESEAVQETGPVIPLGPVALIHIHLFSKTHRPILGNLAPRLSLAQVEAALELVKTKVNVWGYRTPEKYANEVAA